MYSSEAVFNDVTMMHVNSGLKRRCVEIESCDDTQGHRTKFKTGACLVCDQFFFQKRDYLAAIRVFSLLFMISVYAMCTVYNTFHRISWLTYYKNAYPFF